MDIHELQQTVEIALAECGQREAVRQFEALERSRRVDALELFSRSTDRLSRQNRICGTPGQISRAPEHFGAWRGNLAWPAAPSSATCRN